MVKIGRRLFMLMLIGLDDQADKGLGGITRIQKLLYLLDSEENIKPGADGFNFVPYKAGPYSPAVYDDLESLENFGYLKRHCGAKPVGKSGGDPTFEELMGLETEATAAEKSEVDLTFEELMGPEDVIGANTDEFAPTSDSYKESRYCLTEKGRAKIEELLKNQDYAPFVEGIRKVKSRFAKYSLNDLLYYVYTKHPDMTTESEIKEKVLRRRQVRH
ncbi:MAG: hypothetical protein P4K83_12415 [Terracidiphilus sp.]|nr:hypothetical protein [Terracidiphilus sp.]